MKKNFLMKNTITEHRYDTYEQNVRIYLKYMRDLNVEYDNQYQED